MPSPVTNMLPAAAAPATQNPTAAASRVNNATINPAQLLQNREQKNAQSVKDSSRSPTVPKRVEASFSKQAKKAAAAKQLPHEQEEPQDPSQNPGGEFKLDILA